MDFSEDFTTGRQGADESAAASPQGQRPRDGRGGYSNHDYGYGQPAGARRYRPRMGEGSQRMGGYGAPRDGENNGYGYGERRNYRPRQNNYDGGSWGGPRYGSSAPRERSYDNRGGYGRPRFNRDGERRPYGDEGRERYGRPNRFGAQRRPYDNRLQKRRTAFAEKVDDPTQPVRLNKFLANSGICSRRDADGFIQAGVVTVNGVVVTELGTKVMRTDDVRFHDQPVKPELKVYVLLNKPKGYVTTNEDPQDRKTVMDLVKKACPERIYPVGRLDRNTTGVLLLTNDGELASRLTHPKYLKKKIYHVWLDHSCTAADMKKITEGIELDDGVIKADEVEYAHPTDKKQVGIQIHSGRNRIVRRIFESLGYHVTKLDRVFFAGLTKRHLRRGDWRYLTEEEVNFLRMGSFE